MGANVVSCVFIEDSHKRHTMKKHQITAINYLIDNIRAIQTYSTVTTHTQKNTIKDNNTRQMKRMESDTISSDFTLTTTCKKRPFEATVKLHFSRKQTPTNAQLLFYRKKGVSLRVQMNNY